MGLVKIEFEFGKNKFDKKLIELFGFIYHLYRITLANWKREGKKKKPKLLNFRLVRFSFIFSLFTLVAISLLGTLLQHKKVEILEQILLLVVFLLLAIATAFLFIFTVVSLFYLFSKFVKALFKTIQFVSNACRK